VGLIDAHVGTLPNVYIASLPWLFTDLSHVSNSVQLNVPGLVSICAQVVFVSHSRTPPNGTVGKCEALIWLILSPKKLGGRPVAVGVGAGTGAGAGVGEVAVATLTDAEADFVGSALLIAVTVSVPAVEGAVY
jgi:hypothetical protein